MFDARIRMMGFVERWNIAPRLHRQSVAEHSYFVAIYASDLCRWLDLPEWQRIDVLEYALRHDLAEVQTGDMPGPAKRAVVDPRRLADYEQAFLLEVKQHQFLDTMTDELKAVVKAADTIEAWFFVALEVARGNILMKGELHIARDRAYLAMGHLFQKFPTRATGWHAMFEVIAEQVNRLFGPMALSPRLDSDLPPLTTAEDEIPF